MIFIDVFMGLIGRKSEINIEFCIFGINAKNEEFMPAGKVAKSWKSGKAHLKSLDKNSHIILIYFGLKPSGPGALFDPSLLALF